MNESCGQPNTEKIGFVFKYEFVIHVPTLSKTIVNEVRKMFRSKYLGSYIKPLTFEFAIREIQSDVELQRDPQQSLLFFESIPKLLHMSAPCTVAAICALPFVYYTDKEKRPVLGHGTWKADRANTKQKHGPVYSTPFSTSATRM